MDWGDCLEPISSSPGDKVATLRCVPVVLKYLVNGGLMFAGGTALFFLIYAGIQLVNSGGDAKKLESARRTMTFAIVGLILILLSFTIINFVSFVSGVPCINFAAVGFDTCR